MTTTTASLRPSAHPGVLADLVAGSSLLRNTLRVCGGLWTLTAFRARCLFWARGTGKPSLRGADS
jgi:hypothetical protein